MERGAKGGGFKIRLRFTHHALLRFHPITQLPNCPIT